jgi:hypothetical protein
VETPTFDGTVHLAIHPAHQHLHKALLRIRAGAQHLQGAVPGPIEVTGIEPGTVSHRITVSVPFARDGQPMNPKTADPAAVNALGFVRWMFDTFYDCEPILRGAPTSDEKAAAAQVLARVNRPRSVLATA